MALNDNQNDNNNKIDNNDIDNINKRIIEPSILSMSTNNEIMQRVIHEIDINNYNKDKNLINVSIGDLTLYPSIIPNTTVTTKALQTLLLSQQFNGYGISYGLKSARVALSKKYETPNIPINENDVILCNGCSEAISMSMCCLLNKDENILLPRKKLLSQRY